MKREFFSFRTLLVVLGFSVLALSSCKDDDDDDIVPDDPMPASVAEVISESDDHATLAAAVSAAGLTETLSGNGPFTVFAPTDDAFDALPEGTLQSLLDDAEGALTDILLYHVVETKAMSSGLSNGQNIPTLFGEDVTVTINSEGVFINDAKVTIADIETENGVVHVIDAVLMPEAPMPATVVDIVVGSADHETLEAAVTAAGLVETLQGDGPFTVFAPTDAAFGALPEGTLDALLADPEGDLKDILLYHVVAGEAMSSDLSDGQEIETVLGSDITVTINNDGVFINDAQVTVANIEAENGVVHVIDAVLTPMPATVVDIVVGSADHETLEAAVTAAGLVETLQGDGPFTVFAPTDAVFAALPDGTLDDLLDDPSGVLTDILLYHVVAGKAMSSDLSDGQEIETVFGDDITVAINNDGVFINDAMVTVADIEAENGVVHVIDAMLGANFYTQVIENDTYGSILADGAGNTLYFFTQDADGSSACTGGCLDNWPVFYNESLYLSAGLDPDDFGSIDRGNGIMQTTYKGWPLYYFADDNEAGDVNGEGVIDKWFVAKPDYTIMLTDNQLVGNDGVNYTGDYGEGDEVIQYLVDAYGNTLYTWTNDRNNRNRFTASDFSNNSAWPIFNAEGMIIPSTLNSDDFDVIDVYGESQLTFKGWPLYYFGQDDMRGETNGVSVPSPGVWPVAVPDITEAPAYTVVDIVVSSPDHETLTAAVTAAELVETLQGEGPFTVFAPTDDAFEALPDGTLDALLADPEGDLKDILLYHVVAAKAMSGDLSDGQEIETVFGNDVTVTINNEGVFINDAEVTVADIEADNGVVHVIDAVLIP
ncbi:MAG: fasciclin domain-containing protein [Bacteroidales bacterium]